MIKFNPSAFFACACFTVFVHFATPSLLEIVLFVLEPVPLLGQRLDLLQHLLRVELQAVRLLRLGIEPRVKLRDL